LFFGGPKERRRFVDLGMFHVKHLFSKQWREFSRVLKQRNACIRNGADAATLRYWTDVFCQQSEAVALIRDEYVESLVKELTYWLTILLPDISDKVSVQYHQGWPQKRTLAESLNANKEREQSFGYSLYGAHKFDVKFMLAKQALESQLSRGQQKLFLLALTFAQAKLIARVKRVKPILLIDDIGAELDTNSRLALSRAIDKLNCQVVITAIEESVLKPFTSINNNLNKSNDLVENTTAKYSMFHVKHGNIKPVNNSVMSE
jgi:DNA replication and repair protein RecF